jgi:hypothetical protein
MMFDKNVGHGGSRFLSYEQIILKCFFGPHIQQWWWVWLWVWPNFAILLHHEISTLTIIFLMFIVVFRMGNDLGFGLWDFFLNPFIKKHCIITHVWMQLVIVTNIQPPQRDWCQEKINLLTSHVYGMEHN